jgi:hypothetical protein
MPTPRDEGVEGQVNGPQVCILGVRRMYIRLAVCLGRKDMDGIEYIHEGESRGGRVYLARREMGHITDDCIGVIEHPILLACHEQ